MAREEARPKALTFHVSTPAGHAASGGSKGPAHDGKESSKEGKGSSKHAVGKESSKQGEGSSKEGKGAKPQHAPHNEAAATATAAEAASRKAATPHRANNHRGTTEKAARPTDNDKAAAARRPGSMLNGPSSERQSSPSKP